LGQLRLQPEQFYNLTYRQFSNAVNGYRKQKDIESRERFNIMRKIMWSALLPNMKKGFKETDIVEFSWEKSMIKKLTIEENQKLLSDIEKVKEFYQKVDGKA
jgi:hypothetical protein